MNLRDATHEKHRLAEQTDFSQSMINGNLTVELYHQFLFNMFQIYEAIENKINFLPADISRVQKYKNDLSNLNRGAGTTLTSTNSYVRHIYSLTIPQVWAHIYVHYLGNMYGGQMLKKNLIWPSSHLDFNDVKAAISYIRSNINDVDPNEANTAFDWTIKVYDELYKTFRSNSSTAQ